MNPRKNTTNSRKKYHGFPLHFQSYAVADALKSVPTGHPPIVHRASNGRPPVGHKAATGRPYCNPPPKTHTYPCINKYNLLILLLQTAIAGAPGLG